MRKLLSVVALSLSIASAPANAAFLFGYSGLSNYGRDEGFNEELVINNAISINADNAGWFYQDGTHEARNDNYAVGFDILEDYENFLIDGDIRNFLGFDLSGVTSAVSSAKIRIVLQPGYFGESPAEGLPALWRLYDVSSEPDYRIAYSGATDIFNDLGSGITFGSVVQSASSGIVEVELNARAIAEINSNLGQRFVIGGALSPIASAVPEPATWLTMLAGFGLIGSALRSIRRKAIAISA